MPRNVPPVAPPDPNFILTTKLINNMRAWWVEQMKENPEVDPMLFTRLSLVAFSQMAAITAIDVGVPADKFQDICNHQFKEAFKRAPRFS